MECINEVASVIYAESRGETERGMRAVAHVIFNRAKEQGKKPCFIVKQPKQFAKGIYKPSDPLWQLARKKVLNPGRDLTNGATYFHNRTVRPYWIKSVNVTFAYREHIFYK